MVTILLHVVFCTRGALGVRCPAFWVDPEEPVTLPCPQLHLADPLDCVGPGAGAGAGAGAALLGGGAPRHGHRLRWVVEGLSRPALGRLCPGGLWPLAPGTSLSRIFLVVELI